MSGTASTNWTVPLDFEGSLVSRQVNPIDVRNMYAGVERLAQNMSGRFPREQVVFAVQYALHAAIDSIAKTPSPRDVIDRYSLPNKISPAAIPAFAFNMATSGMQAALAMADTLGSSLNLFPPGKLQEAFAASGHTAVNNAMTHLPQAPGNIRKGVEQAVENAGVVHGHSANPATGLLQEAIRRMERKAKMEAEANLMTTGGTLGQMPVINKVSDE